MGDKAQGRITAARACVINGIRVDAGHLLSEGGACIEGFTDESVEAAIRSGDAHAAAPAAAESVSEEAIGGEAEASGGEAEGSGRGLGRRRR